MSEKTALEQYKEYQQKADAAKASAEQELVDEIKNYFKLVTDDFKNGDKFEAIVFVLNAIGLDIKDIYQHFESDAPKPIKKGKRLSKEEEDALIEDLKAGDTAKELAKKYGVSTGKISTVKKQAGLTK